MSLSRTIASHIIKEEFTVSTLVEVLTKYKLVPLLPSIMHEVKKLSLHSMRDDTIMIETPFPLSQDAIQKVKRIVGNDIASHDVTINKSILAGFKARFKGKLYDGSAERIIRQLTGR